MSGYKTTLSLRVWHVTRLTSEPESGAWGMGRDNTNPVSDQFLKISEDVQKFFRRSGERFQICFAHFPKISEKAPMMFRSYSNIFKYF